MCRSPSLLLTVASISFVFFNLCNALYGPSSPVVQLTPSNFKSKVLNSNGVVLVEFFAPWCGHCQALTPIWEKAATVLKGVATVAALDADAHQSLAQEYGIRGFPTIKVFAPGKPPVDYQGARDVKPIAEFALQQIKTLLKERLNGKAAGGSSGKSESSASVELNSHNFDEFVLKSKELWVVEFFAPWCGHCKKLAPEWKKAANNLKGKVKLGHVDCDSEKSLMSRFNVQGFPTILVFGADKDSPIPYEGARTASAIESFALEQLETNVVPPEVTELTDQGVMEEKCGSAAICFVAFLPDILDSKAEGRNKYLQMLLLVACNPVNGRVSEVSLDSLGLSGKIGRGLQKLQHLKVLSLSRNNFTGNISPELGVIGSLESLNLSHNSLSGPIPASLVNANSLAFLDLSENSLSGPLPDDLFQNCLSLRYLSLAGNLLEGPLPSTLAKCSLLHTLNLSKSYFSGNPSFVAGIWSLQRLRTLDLSHNAFSGSIPEGVSALHNLKVLLLRSNHFSGPLPGDIGLCPHLSTLDFSNNLFSGTVPDSLQRLNSLMFFSLSSNMLTGDFPSWIGNLSSLVYLDFSNNDLTGSLPSSMGNMRSLKFLGLSDNRLTGDIPMSLMYCTQLSVIQIRGNGFNGSIPEGLFDLGLEEVDFSHNRLIGSIPPGSSKLFESLRRLDLSSNNLTGSIPAEMGLFANLRYLNLSWNNLQSRIPPELGFIQNLTVLDLRSSALFGSVPEDICESGSLAILQLDGNSLTGAIPEELGNCSSIYLLSLSHNNLSGSIPESISKLSKLKILQLEFNELNGEIPPELGKLQNLLAVNISFNRLVGRLPAGSVFQSLDQSALQGNLGICSPLLKGPCKMNVPKPLVLDPNAYNNQMNGHRQRNSSSTPSRFHHHMFLSVSAIVAISAAVFIACGVIIISLLNVSARRRLTFVDNTLESMCSSSSPSGSLPTGKLILFDSRSSPEWISNPQCILNKAAEIGEGVFGTVYKVSLGAQGRNMVIKKLVTSNIIQNPEDFDREVRVLGKARQPNLISLKGYYWTPHLQLLVSEYAPNGSLQAKLHERLPSTPPLSWATRFKIIFGTAKGLAHLHHSFRPPIIHYNIKPSNILLDENCNPKISDFGLARLLTKLETHVISNRFQSALGYVAPELACQSLRVNEKCDIYSFGVLILELVTGRRPVEYGEDNVVILSDHVRVLLEQGNILDCVDLNMADYPEDEVLPVLKLALVCTSQIPSSRPSMADVVQILQVIKTPVSQRMEIF